MALLLSLAAAFAYVQVRYPSRYQSVIERECKRFSVPQTLVRGVIWAESKFKPQARSGAGAVGLMQIMPSTAKFLSRELNTGLSDEEVIAKLTEPKFNVMLGTYYLSYLLNEFDEKNAVAAYNAGEGNLRKWQEEGRREYPFKETRDYVKRVFSAKKVYGFKETLGLS